ncbi:MAG: hypothetical protein HKN28_16880 [Alphaproteobacteria bacterium]|nr:hypothetical protein [Alphaproteobacteria bacterium]
MIDALPLDRFLDLVASYGADPGRWPADLRAGAVSCLAQSEAARMAWQEAANLDADLDTLSSLELSPELAQSVLAIADAPPKQGIALLPTVLPYAAAAAIALVIGLSVPSPLRDATDVAPQVATVITAPVIEADTDNSEVGLTTLALVDVTAFADNEGDTSDSSSDDISLSSLPLL